MSTDSSELAVVDDDDKHDLKPIKVANAFDLAPSVFKKQLDRQGANRDALMSWIKGNLVEGVDYGRIHIMPKSKCNKGKNCEIKWHFSKDTLFKSGAEKIAGMMGFRATWPRLGDYEQMCIGGGLIAHVGLRCELLNSSGHLVSEGWGARSIDPQYPDLNKAVKMAKKSGLIDAVLNAGGLSEVFTQDLDDIPPEGLEDGESFDPYSPAQEQVNMNQDFDRNDLFPFGKHKGQPWLEVPIDYLEWAIENMRNLRADTKQRIEREIQSRLQDTAERVASNSTQQSKPDTVQDAEFEELSDEDLERERLARVDSRPLKYYADLIAAAKGKLELDDIAKEISGSLHEKPLQAFLSERQKHFANWS